MEYLSLTYKNYSYSEYKIVLKTKETENYLGKKTLYIYILKLHTIFCPTSFKNIYVNFDTY